MFGGMLFYSVKGGCMVTNSKNKEWLFVFSTILLNILIFSVVLSIAVASGFYISDTIFGTAIAKHLGLHHVLMLLIFAEIVAMVVKYVDEHQVPVEFMAYLVITAIARNIIVGIETMNGVDLILYSLSVFVLIFAVGYYRYWCAKQEKLNMECQ